MRWSFKLKTLLSPGRKPAASDARPRMELAELFQLDPNDPGRAGGRADLPRFHASAADQLDRRRLDRNADVRLKLRDAFTPSQPVADRRMFAGRVGVLTQMIRAIEDQRLHPVLYGERGIGKTSLLHVLRGAAKDARYIVVYTSCGAASSFDEMFRAAAADIPLLYHRSYAPTAAEAEAGATLADVLPSERLTPRAFGEVCAKLTGTRVLLILDEFDRATAPDFRRELAELIKILSDRAIRVQLVIAGVAVDLADLVEHIPSIRRNIMALRVPLMSDEEVLQLVQNGERTSGVAFEPAACNFVVSMSLGSPYFANLIAHHASLIALDNDRLTVKADDVTCAIDQALEELRERLPRAAQAQVDRLLEQGAGGLLSTIAAAALSAGGMFDVQDLEQVKRADAARGQRLVEELAAEGVIFATRDDSGGRRYAFVEEGAAAYIWFYGAREQSRSKAGARVNSA